jgi:hypothetical protein
VFVAVTPAKEKDSLSYFFVVFVTAYSLLGQALCSRVQRWLCCCGDESHNPETELNAVHFYHHYTFGPNLAELCVRYVLFGWVILDWHHLAFR